MNGLAVAQESVRAIVMMRMLHAAMACKQNRGRVGRSSEAKSEHSSIALSPGSEVPMRFGPLFARGETLATRRNATDGTPPSGVVKINSHQYTKALWQRMVAVLVAVSMATSLTPSAAFANENAEGTAADQPALAASSDAASGDAGRQAIPKLDGPRVR